MEFLYPSSSSSSSSTITTAFTTLCHDKSSSLSSTITTAFTTLCHDNACTPKIKEILESREHDIPSAANDCCVNAENTNTLIISKSRTSRSYIRDSRKFPKTTTIGWFSGMFRGILCRDSLPNCPSDHLKLQFQINPTSVQHVKQLQGIQTEDKTKPSASPGVIAKLMGLEPLPPIKFCDTEKSHRCSFSRKYVGELKKQDSNGENPTFLVLEDETFIILSFEKRDAGIKSAEEKDRRGEKNKRSKRRRQSVCEKNKENYNVNCNLSNEQVAQKVTITQKGCSACDGKLKDSRNILCKNLFGGLELKKLEKGNGFGKHVSEKGRKRIQKIRAVGSLLEDKRHTDCDSDNSSPNSVLEKIVFPCDLEVSSAGELSRLSNSKSSTLKEEVEKYRKLLNTEDTNCLINNNSSHCKTVSTESKVAKLRNNECKNLGCLKLWSNIQEQAEKESIWIWTQRRCKFLEEEISVEIEVEIMAKLLEEMVDQFLV